jgi:hypothetical protein
MVQEHGKMLCVMLVEHLFKAMPWNSPNLLPRCYNTLERIICVKKKTSVAVAAIKSKYLDIHQLGNDLEALY